MCHTSDVDRPRTGDKWEDGEKRENAEIGDNELMDRSPAHFHMRPHPQQLYGKGDVHMCNVHVALRSILQRYRCGCVLIGGRRSGWG